ncbi:MAG: hypothetical protein ACREYE_13730 [Gammaproteobacteria bacterium]
MVAPLADPEVACACTLFKVTKAFGCRSDTEVRQWVC